MDGSPSNAPYNYVQRQTSALIQRTRDSFRGYNRASLGKDLTAGITIGIVAIPQAMAYAMIAEVSPIYGIYTVIFQGLLGALFSSHPLLNLGPVNSQSLVVASIVTRIQSPGDPEAYLTLVVTLTFLKGAIQTAMAALRLGQLTRFVSRSVVVGFTAGAGLLIAAKQVGPFLGFATPRLPGDWPGVIGIIQEVVRGIAAWNPAALALGCLSLAIVAGCRSRRLPGPLFAILACGLAVALLGYTPKDLDLVGKLPIVLESWPAPRLDPATLERLLPAALALALLGAIETHAIAKSLSRRSGRASGLAPSSNQDMFGQGLTGIVTAFLACIPGSTSLTRSALNQSAGAQTLLANVTCCLIVAAALSLFADAAQFVPISSIAGILLIVAWSLVDWGFIRRVTRTTKADSSVLLATFLATLLIPLEYAVLVGITLNIALYLQRTTQLQLKELIRNEEGDLEERPLQRDSDDQLRFLQLEGSLFFAQAEELEAQLRELTCSPAVVVIFRMRRVHSMDATMLSVLEQFIRRMHDDQRHVLVCGLAPNLMERLGDFGLLDALGEENVFPTSVGVFASAQAALDRGGKLLIAATTP